MRIHRWNKYLLGALCTLPMYTHVYAADTNPNATVEDINEQLKKLQAIGVKGIKAKIGSDSQKPTMPELAFKQILQKMPIAINDKLQDPIKNNEDVKKNLIKINNADYANAWGLLLSLSPLTNEDLIDSKKPNRSVVMTLNKVLIQTLAALTNEGLGGFTNHLTPLLTDYYMGFIGKGGNIDNKDKMYTTGAMWDDYSKDISGQIDNHVKIIQEKADLVNSSNLPPPPGPRGWRNEYVGGFTLLGFLIGYFLGVINYQFKADSDDEASTSAKDKKKAKKEKAKKKKKKERKPSDEDDDDDDDDEEDDEVSTSTKEKKKKKEKAKKKKKDRELSDDEDDDDEA